MTQARALSWMEAAGAVIDRLAATQGEAIGEASRWCADAIAAVAIINCIKVRTARLLGERGALPSVITRASVVGADRSRKLFDDAYREHARRIARAIDQRGGG
jgi:hypothetical protein